MAVITRAVSRDDFSSNECLTYSKQQSLLELFLYETEQLSV